MNRTLAITAGLAALVAAGAAVAQGPKGGDRWDRLDADKDGKVTAEELAAPHSKLIDAADTDGDGALSKAEMKAHHDARRAERQAKRFPDANDDGVVDLAEYQTAAAERFRKMDANGDGVLSEDEAKSHHRRGKHRGKRY